MLSNQLGLNLSNYSDIYDIVIPQDHILRKINDMIDFSFIYEELENKYCLDNGRNAQSPIRLFKYLFLKYLYNLSDNGVVERSRYDMSFKYFLDMTPEENVIHPSLLTKFRTLRLKDKNLQNSNCGFNPYECALPQSNQDQDAQNGSIRFKRSYTENL